ncbi:hypothetical protein JIG36_17055 [Actinoplanes sp. LDG1-06]|uniref:Lipoprotein n=1 Tax=Paractinoplanes ovalisporus TaxID=2810368 RepID=A0ABS2ABQ6_9ACTN|nr:hypothetical protein [Actinoplanes ovalisporus]MBM2617265.1 hypothetical protein [Actinoplanes ovalisporus]
MRRALLAVIAGSLLLTGAACDSDADSNEAAAPATTAPSTAPSSAAPDYTANTKQVCTKLQTLYTVELRDFGSAMGKLITYREAKQTAEITKAEAAATTELKQVAAKIRNDTAAAQNPEFKAAGMTSAAKVDASAANKGYVKTVTTMTKLNSTIENQFKEWLSPVAGYCAA